MLEEEPSNRKIKRLKNLVAGSAVAKSLLGRFRKRILE